MPGAGGGGKKLLNGHRVLFGLVGNIVELERLVIAQPCETH